MDTSSAFVRTPMYGGNLTMNVGGAEKSKERILHYNAQRRSHNFFQHEYFYQAHCDAV